MIWDNEKWQRICPECKKRLKYYDPIGERHWLAAEFSRINKIRVSRNDIVGYAECCKSGWIKLVGMV